MLAWKTVKVDNVYAPSFPALVDDLWLDLLDASADYPTRRDGDDDDESDEDALDGLRASVLGCKMVSVHVRVAVVEDERTVFLPIVEDHAEVDGKQLSREADNDGDEVGP